MRCMRAKDLKVGDELVESFAGRITMISGDHGLITVTIVGGRIMRFQANSIVYVV